MKSNDVNPGDSRLREILREARPSASLPPRFQEAVWRRIERESARAPGWLDDVVERLLRPRLALAAVAVILLLGAVLGARDGLAQARHSAQERYLSAVAPFRGN